MPRYDASVKSSKCQSELTRPSWQAASAASFGLQGRCYNPPMPAIEDSRVLVIGGAGFVGSHIVDQLDRRARARDRRARQPRARHAQQPGRRARGRARDPRRGLGRGRRAPARPHARHRLRVPPRRAVALRVRARAAQGARGERRRHLQRGRDGARGGRQEGRLLLVGVGLRQRGRRADDRGAPVPQPHDVRRDEDRRRAVLPRVPRAARARLRRPPLHEHLRPADGLQGHVRQRDHEGARPDRRRASRR